jgi:hypothetical protein
VNKNLIVSAMKIRNYFFLDTSIPGSPVHLYNQVIIYFVQYFPYPRLVILFRNFNLLSNISHFFPDKFFLLIRIQASLSQIMSQLVRFYGPMIISYMTMMVIMILAFQMRRQMMFFKL